MRFSCAAVTIGAASRDQARICFERMRGFAQHPAVEDHLVVRHLELRHPDGDGLLRVVPSDGPRVHGLSSTLYIGDEVWSWPDSGLLEAMTTGLVKRHDSKLLVISTAAAQLDSPLGRMRARALAQGHDEAHGRRHRSRRRSALAGMVAARRGRSRRHEGRDGVQPGALDHGRRSQAPARRRARGRVRAVSRLPLGYRRGLMAARRRLAGMRRRAALRGWRGRLDRLSTSAANAPRRRWSG